MILVTGATGNIGKPLVSLLAERKVPFRALVRDGPRAATLPAGVEKAVGDLEKPASLGAAFEGVDQLFLLTQGIETRQVEHALAAAKQAGVGHVVHLSSMHVTYEPLPKMARWHADREALVRASGLASTFLRPGAFMTNALDWRATIREGFVIDPVGPGKFAPIDPEDIAEIAAQTLTERGHAGQAYLLTGDECLTIADEVEILGRALGRTLEVRVPVDVAQMVRARFPAGAPPVLADAIIEGFQRMREDTVGHRDDTAQRLLGRRPKTFADWCARNAPRFD